MQQVKQIEIWHEQGRAWTLCCWETLRGTTHRTILPTDNRGVPTLSSLQRFKMSGMAAKLQHNRDRVHGIGTNSHAQKYLNQDFESLRASCLERGELFQDECFEALPSSLGFNELGPYSYKVRGITWKRPKVGARYTPIMQFGDVCSFDIGKLICNFLLEVGLDLQINKRGKIWILILGHFSSACKSF